MVQNCIKILLAEKIWFFSEIASRRWMTILHLCYEVDKVFLILSQQKLKVE